MYGEFTTKGGKEGWYFDNAALCKLKIFKKTTTTTPPQIIALVEMISPIAKHFYANRILVAAVKQYFIGGMITL